MFGNRMVYTSSPGGQRRGLVYQSGSGEPKILVFKEKLIFSLSQSCIFYLGDYGFTVSIMVDKKGDAYFFFAIDGILDRNSENFKTIRKYNDITCSLEGWYPLMIMYPWKYYINGTLIDMSDLEFERDQLKCVKETFTYTNIYDGSQISYDCLVFYINTDILLEHTYQYYSEYQVMEEVKPVKIKIGSGVSYTYDEYNHIKTEVNGFYFPDINYATDNRNGYYPGSFFMKRYNTLKPLKIISEYDVKVLNLGEHIISYASPPVMGYDYDVERIKNTKYEYISNDWLSIQDKNDNYSDWINNPHNSFKPLVPQMIAQEGNLPESLSLIKIGSLEFGQYATNNPWNTIQTNIYEGYSLDPNVPYNEFYNHQLNEYTGYPESQTNHFNADLSGNSYQAVPIYLFNSRIESDNLTAIGDQWGITSTFMPKLQGDYGNRFTYYHIPSGSITLQSFDETFYLQDYPDYYP